MDCKSKKLRANFLLIFVLISVVKSSEIEKVKITCETTKATNPDGILEGDNLIVCYTGNDTKVLTSNAVVENELKDDSIEAIWFGSSSQIHYIPKGLKENYPKLKALSFYEQPLKTLSENDLEQFGSYLEGIGVIKGKITYLTRNLFRHNQNLKIINFYANPLKFIEPEFFENISKMKQLEFIDLGSCSCINEMKNEPNIQNATWTHNCNDRSVIVHN